MKHKFLLLFLIVFSNYLIASSHPINHSYFNSGNKTLYEIDLVYPVKIQNSIYFNDIKLLRSLNWLQRHQLKRRDIGQWIAIDLPALHFNHKVKVLMIHGLSMQDTKKMMTTKQSSIVIGVLKHYTDQVELYRFKDKTTGKIYKIFATPNHPFYIVNKKKFMAISTINSNDQLLSQSHKIMYLICEKNQMSGCGVKNSRLTSVLPVYNLEVAKYHTFFVSQANILVHNCSTVDGATGSKLKKTTMPSIDELNSQIQNSFNSMSVDEMLEKFENKAQFFSGDDPKKAAITEFNFDKDQYGNLLPEGQKADTPYLEGITENNQNRISYSWFKQHAPELTETPEKFTTVTKLNDFLFNAGGDYVVGIVFRFPEVVENPESELGFLHQEINGYVNEHEFRNWGNQLIVDKLRGIN